MRKHLAAASCVLVLSGLTGCGSDAPDGYAGGPTRDESSAVVMEKIGSSQLRFGQPHRFADGLSITVSEPKSFTPTKAAYPRADRAVAFQILVHNSSNRIYRLTGMSITVAADGAPADEIVDAAMGFNGMTDTDLHPSSGTLVSLAYAVPTDAAELTLTLHPGAEGTASAFYAGQA